MSLKHKHSKCFPPSHCDLWSPNGTNSTPSFVDPVWYPLVLSRNHQLSSINSYKNKCSRSISEEVMRVMPFCACPISFTQFPILSSFFLRTLYSIKHHTTCSLAMNQPLDRHSHIVPKHKRDGCLFRMLGSIPLCRHPVVVFIDHTVAIFQIA